LLDTDNFHIYSVNIIQKLSNFVNIE